MPDSISSLLKEIRSCTVCTKDLPLGPRPIVRFAKQSKILLVGQAPGTRVHESGIPWNDPSGDRLRSWLTVTREQFYDENNFAIAPMGFCYPGRGKSGDNPPRPECAPLWMDRITRALPEIRLTILVGQYALDYFLRKNKKENLTETVRQWKQYFPEFVVLPHPSPRNNIWLKKNEWFEKELVPELSEIVKEYMNAKHVKSKKRNKLT